MTKERTMRRKRWARIHDFEAAVMATMDGIYGAVFIDEPPQDYPDIGTIARTPVTLYHEPSDEDRNAVEAIEDERRERDDG